MSSLQNYLQRHPRYGIGASAVPWDAQLPAYIRITDIDQHSRYRPDPAVSVADPMAVNYSLVDGDLVVARTGASVGKSYRYRPIDGALVFAGFLMAVRPDPNVLDPDYLSFIFQSRHYWDWITAESMRSGQPGINAQQLAQLEINPPSIEEQRAVAGALQRVVELIDASERLIAKKHDVKHGMMQELLTGRTRLPGFTDAWRSRMFGDLLTYRQPTKYLVNDTEYIESGTPVLTAGKTFILGYTPEDHGIFSDLPVIIFDDFTTDSKYVEFPFKAKSSAMKMLIPKEDTDLRWAYERMQITDFVAVDHKRRWISEYSKIEIDVPTLAEQAAIAAVSADADAEIEALERRLESVRAVKVGMMQELLMGRTRLPVEERA